jgi:hypothetical protein
MIPSVGDLEAATVDLAGDVDGCVAADGRELVPTDQTP